VQRILVRKDNEIKVQILRKLDMNMALAQNYIEWRVFVHMEYNCQGLPPQMFTYHRCCSEELRKP
jgi:hypothetical protein